jgi:hypothetical protein
MEIWRVAATRSKVFAERFKNDLTLHYLNAKLQRAKTIPKLEKLTGEGRKAPTVKNITERLMRAPTFTPQG